jgi:hypothetical protein
MSLMTMAIISVSQDVSLPLTCAICRVNLSLARATAGLYYCDNRQAFSCVSHLSEVEKLIIGWADFITTELEKCSKYGNTPANLIYKEVGDADRFYA